ncbi:hypothetical protein S7711_07864 [Stachybotrys chartarum IBT 7711]|uniref:Acid phosphatase n=1 Tax=Stachybotrys chartarum (strain CBS 109288 / IBT 7711) TaxID=1280523 RepID=A0A084AXQ1_STACB|nr:hypothetical protein S7711_07864 [Stachybotrys chartarum IBT 7711]
MKLVHTDMSWVATAQQEPSTMHAALLSFVLALVLATIAARPAAAEQVLGLYVFHRHGDRTAQARQPVSLTPLGLRQVVSSGAFYRGRYVAADAPRRICGFSSDEAVWTQLGATSSLDPVAQKSVFGFLQGLYPPVNAAVAISANGTRVAVPLLGYQYVPINAPEDGVMADKAEHIRWRLARDGCANAEASSLDFYRSLSPFLNGSVPRDKANYNHSYPIYDVVNAASTHSSLLAPKELLTRATLDRLFALASTHEWNLAYNTSEPIRSIAGAVLAGKIMKALEAIVMGCPDAPRFHVDFGDYDVFMAFFGLAALPRASLRFYGICDYASSMAFELVTNATQLSAEHIGVRFYVSNGTAVEEDLTMYPLFGQDTQTLPWLVFKAGMSEFAVQDAEHWCQVCGNTGTECVTAGSGGTEAPSEPCEINGGISNGLAGAIGVIVALVVLLCLEAAVMLIGGLCLVKKPIFASTAADMVSWVKI